MKIKPCNKKKVPAYVCVDGQWVPYERRKSTGRLKQLNKFNSRSRTVSEFIRMCRSIELSYAN